MDIIASYLPRARNSSARRQHSERHAS